ncbi:hypothetical protein D3C80_1095300 [compost metagenome]
MVLGLIGRAKGAGDGQQPQGDEDDRPRDFRPVTPVKAAVEHGNQPGQYGGEHHQEQLHLQAPGANPGLQATGQAHDGDQRAFEQVLAVQATDDGRTIETSALELIAQQQIEQGAAGQCDQAHDHRRVQAVPDGQAVLGQRAADYRLRRRREQRADYLGRENSHQQAGEHQQLDRRAHPAWWLVGCVWQVGRGRAEKHVHGETQGVSHAEGTGNGCHDRQAQFDPARGIDEHGFGEEHLFGEEAVEQRHAGHRGAGDHGQGGGERHQFVQAAEFADIAGTAFVVDDAGGHEQRGLERRVVEDVEHRGDGGQRAVQAEQQGDQAEVADGRVGQQSLEVVLEHRAIRPEQQGAGAGATDDVEPFFTARKRRP